MLYTKFNVREDDRKSKEVLFTNTYSDGTESDVLLRFLNKYDDSDEIDTKDISKLLALNERNIRYKIKSGGLRPYYVIPEDIFGQLRKRTHRARVFQLKEIIKDNNESRKCRKELLDFLDDRVDRESPNYEKPIDLDRYCSVDGFPFDEDFTYNTKIKDLFIKGLCRGLVRPRGVENFNDLLRAHKFPFELEQVGTGNKRVYKVHEVPIEPMVIKIYR